MASLEVLKVLTKLWKAAHILQIKKFDQTYLQQLKIHAKNDETWLNLNTTSTNKKTFSYNLERKAKTTHKVHL